MSDHDPPFHPDEDEAVLDEDEAVLDEDPGEDGDDGDDGYFDPLDLQEPGDIPAEMIELEKIPRRLWEQTLAPMHRQQRVYVAHRIPDRRLRELASNLTFELDMEECERRRAGEEARYEARRTGVPLPTPASDHGASRPTVQVNVRLRRDDHARLTQAAAAVGLKPTTLARALVLNGAAQVLRDHADRGADGDVGRRRPGYA
jgi:hypothetical protein